MIDDNYFKELDAEIAATKEAAEKELQKSRLLEAMAVYRGEDKLESSHDIAERLKETDPVATHSTGVASLDNLLRGGFRPGQLVVVSAVTGHGKTEFCTFLSQKMQDLKPLWFSYEDGADELVERFLDRKIEVPLFYTPSHLKGNNLKWIEERIVEAVVKYSTSVVFIDNLQCLVPRSQNQAAEYGFTTRELKTMAEKWNVTIVLVHHLTKLKAAEIPELNDIKGSSDVAQDASTVILLWRQTGKTSDGVTVTDNVLVDVAKVRRGKLGKFKMTYNGETYYENNWNQDVEDFDRSFA